MSNHLAVATVSATLRNMLRDPVMNTVGNSADVITDRPDTVTETDPRVCIFLYGIQPNAAWRNQDLPTRRSTSELAQLPQVALDLYYLMSFHGDEQALEPQRLLGTVMTVLHTRPLLSRDEILRMIQVEVGTNPNFPLATSDLADQPELVRFTPYSLDLEQMSQLWSVFFQTAYRLSVAYRASVVLLNVDEVLQSPLPVREPRIYSTTIRRPAIEHVASTAGRLEPVTFGSRVAITGSQLKGDITVVLFGAEPAEPSLTTISDQRIETTVPEDLQAGLIGVRVEHMLTMGDPPRDWTIASSNIAPLVLRPAIRITNNNYELAVSGLTADGNLRSGSLDVTIDPAVGKRQRVVALLNQRNPPGNQPPMSYSFPDESRDVTGGPETTNVLQIPFRDVLAGTYLVRIQVDGAESPLVRQTNSNSVEFEAYIAPEVDIP